MIGDADLFERGRSVLATLRRLAADAPVVVAIDDLQWLDPVSAGALRYAFRRLDHEPVMVVATQRSDRSAGLDDRTLPPARCEQIVIGPLTLECTRAVVSRVADSLPRPALERIHELAAGNPMYAIELARAVALFGDPLVASLHPTLHNALAARVSGVDADVLGMLRVAAALGPSPVAGIERASGTSNASQLVGLAVARDLLVVGDDLVVRFTHPMLASAVLAGINPLDRQALHARLAGIVEDPDARARHLVLSAAEPDAGIAGELETAARRAAQRGQPTHRRRVGHRRG